VDGHVSSTMTPEDDVGDGLTKRPNALRGVLTHRGDVTPRQPDELSTFPPEPTDRGEGNAVMGRIDAPRYESTRPPDHPFR
jgi:hypothetical protein